MKKQKKVTKKEVEVLKEKKQKYINYKKLIKK